MAVVSDAVVSDAVVSDAVVSDAELTALALAADPAAGLAPDAVPIDVFLGRVGAALPEWYMAPVRTRALGRGGRLVVLAVVAAFVVIEAFGLCSTYGQVPFP